MPRTCPIPARRHRRRCTVCHQWKPADRIWKTGACFLCVEFARPVSTPLPAPSAGRQGLIAALATPEATQRLTEAHSALQHIRHQLAEDRRAFQCAAQRETARQIEAEARAIEAELLDVDDTDLIALAPDLHRRTHRARQEP